MTIHSSVTLLSDRHYFTMVQAMEQISKALRTLGLRPAIERAVPTQAAFNVDPDEANEAVKNSIENVNAYIILTKTRL